MASASACMTTMATLLTGAGVGTIYKEFSNGTPPTSAHAVLSHELSALERGDDAGFYGDVTVTAEVFIPGNKSDGQAEYLAAMDQLDNVVTACAAGSPANVREINIGRIERIEESSDLAHWYAGSVSMTFLRQEG